MINWIFYLNGTEIEEPIGFDDIELSLKRDPKLHGFSFEASTAPLQFYGASADILQAAYDSDGVNANVIFKAFFVCEGGYDYEEAISGRLNFGKMKSKCGNLCQIELPLEEESCTVTLNSRYDQKVDIDKPTGVDNTTALQPYDALAVETELPAHDLFLGIDANVPAEGYQVEQIETGLFSSASFAFRPLYSVVRNNSIDTGNIDTGTDAASDPSVGVLPLSTSISPQLLFEDVITCFEGGFEYDVRLKGLLDLDEFAGGYFLSFFRVRLCKGEWPTTLTDIDVQNISFAPPRLFDVSFTGTTTLAEGEGLYMIMEVRVVGNPGMVNMFINVTFDTESHIIVTANKSCPPTTAELYMVHETLSRVTESITNGCIRVKSEYYGRTDSQPFAFTEDGCGGLRSLSSGLKIRKAVEDKFFASLKELIEGLNAIDNIGMGVEVNPDVTQYTDYLLRIEDVQYFYQDVQLLSHDFIPAAETIVDEQSHYSKINVGYKKWEVEKVNGLDEFNSNRQYNTAIDTINSTLEITSGLIAGTYPIEITRQQSFAVSGGADDKYDNDIFILCMKRDSYPYGNISVEQDAVDSPANVFSPETMYNWRISPVRNLMRWYKTIAAGFPSIINSLYQLFFSSGTGNLIAEAKLTNAECRNENSVIKENQNIFVTHFESQSLATPIWKNEVINYEYPMSLAEYRIVKANPYGYISAQCGYGEVLKYWINEVKYKPAKGLATFTLKKKYE